MKNYFSSGVYIGNIPLSRGKVLKKWVKIGGNIKMSGK
jgi:hypothetical protein